MKSVTHLEKVITGEAPAVTHLERVIAQETAAVTYTEKVIAGEAPPITHLQKVIAGEADPVTHLECVWAGGSPPTEHEYTGAVPVTIIADGTPLIDYLISGNTTQNGTPTPESPIMPDGCGELEENVAIIDSRSDTVTNYYYKDVRLSDELPAGTYTISFTMDSKTGDVYVSSLGRGNTTAYQADISTYTISNIPANIIKTITLSSNACIWARFLRSVTLATFSYDVSDIAIVSGDKPYGQYKIPISSASTTTPVYLGEVQTTRKIGKFIFTGTENGWNINQDGRFWIGFGGYKKSGNVIYCTHYVGIENQEDTSSVGNGQICFYSSSINRLIIYDNAYTTVNDFKTYLQQQYAAGTPVCVWYVLATEQTAVVNEPLMKIGDYADTLSKEQAGVSIPTSNGSTTVDVDTELKPSEVYIKYMG